MRETITTKKIIEKVSNATEFMQVDIKAVLEATIAQIRDELMAGNSVRIERLGVFGTKVHRERTVTLGKEPEAIQIPEHRVVTFRAASGLRNAIK